MLNKIAIVGNVVAAPELRYTANGSAVCNIRIASNRKYKSGEEYKEDTCFITVIVWGKRGENCSKYLVKGSPIFIEGRLQSRSWESKDGTKRNTIEIVAEDVQFLNRAKEGTSQEETQEESEEWVNQEDQ